MPFEVKAQYDSLEILLFAQNTDNGTFFEGYIRVLFDGFSFNNSLAQKPFAKPTFSIYPNPALNTLYLKGLPVGDSHIARVFNNQGQLVLSQTIRHNMLVISHLKAGLHTLVLAHDLGETRVVKFVKR